MKMGFLFLILLTALQANAKTFQNSYVAFEVPDNWNCVQEGVAWTCTPQNALEAKEAVIVLAAKVAGPEDNLGNFLAHLKKPKTITTKVGTPMPSTMMYAQERLLAGNRWVQAQHLGSEIQEYYTLYLATVKEQLAILVSFSAEKNKYQKYNAIFDKALKTLKIVANQQLLFPKKAGASGGGGGDVLGINIQPGGTEDMMPPPEKKKSNPLVLLIVLAAAIAAAAVFFTRNRKKISHSKNQKPRPK
jgi:hypothetical protein